MNVAMVVKVNYTCCDSAENTAFRLHVLHQPMYGEATHCHTDPIGSGNHRDLEERSLNRLVRIQRCSVAISVRRAEQGR